MNRDHAIALITRCTELPLYAFLIPLVGKKYIEIDNIYDPKEIIWKKTIYQCDDNLLEEVANAVCQNDLQNRQD